MSRKRLRLAGVLTALALTLTFTYVTAAPSSAEPVWTLRWNPNPASQSPSQAFEGLEDDRANSHPGGQPHIYSTGSAYRFDMHTVDRDGSDRQRNESKGMRTSSNPSIKILKDQTWRISYDLYIPDTLDGASSFQHIAQMKVPGSGAPIYTLSAPTGRLQLRHWNWYPTCCATTEVGSTNLAPIQNKWVNTTFEFKASKNGYLRWVLRDGSTTLVDRQLNNVDMWPEENTYLRPKWGIYRSIESSGLQNTYIMIRNLQAHQQTGTTTPSPTPTRTTTPPPGGNSYEAEASGNTLNGTARTASCSGCSGGAKVGWIGGSGNWVRFNSVNVSTTGDYRLTIYGLVSGTRTFSVNVNNSSPVQVSLTGSSWSSPVTSTITVRLNAGANTVGFYNTGASAPDLDRITVG